MKIVIVGAGEIGSHLAKMLSHEANDITVIDSDSDRLTHLATLADVATVHGDPSSIRVLKEAGVPQTDLFISVMPFVPQDVNLICALLAKNLGAQTVTARVDDEEYLLSDNKLIFKQMGIELLFYPEKLSSDEIVDQLKHTATAESMDFGRGKLQIAVFKLEEDSPLIDMRLSEFAASASSETVQFRVIAVSHNNQTIIPKFDYKFRYHDLVFIISHREGIQALMKFLGKSNIEIGRVMILGGTPIGEMVARQLSKQIDDIKIIEADRDRCLELSERLDDKVIIVNGDGRNSDMLLEEGIKDYDAFLALTKNDEANVLACVVAKKFGVSRTIADVENIEYISLAEEMGVDAVINRKLITAGRIFKFTLSGKARMVRYMSGTEAEVLEYTAAPGSAITKAPLREISFPKDAVIGGVIRGTEGLIAVGDTQIEAYDHVAVFALPSAVKEVDKLFR